MDPADTQSRVSTMLYGVRHERFAECNLTLDSRSATGCCKCPDSPTFRHIPAHRTRHPDDASKNGGRDLLLCVTTLELSRTDALFVLDCGTRRRSDCCI